MIIEYNTTTFDVAVVVAGNDPATITQLTALAPPGWAVFTLADSAPIINALPSFVTANGTTAALKNFITLSSSANPIDLSDSPTITIQLKQSDGVTNLSQSVTVTLSCDLGVASAATVITDGSGTGTFIYQPGKGNSGTITATSPTFLSGSLTIAINTPATPDKQNWIVSNDIKSGAVVPAKVTGFAAKRTKPQAWWPITKPFIRSQFDLGFDDSINSVILDDQGNMYVNGNIGGLATLKKANTSDGTVTLTLDYHLSGSNLADGYDTMAYDGENIWVPANNNLLKVRASDLTLQSTVSIGTGKVESAVWDGQFVWVWLNTTVGAGALYKVTKAGVKTLFPGGAPGFANGTPVVVCVNNDSVFLTSAQSGTITSLKVLPAYGGLQGGPPGGQADQSAALDETSFWFGGTNRVQRFPLSNLATHFDNTDNATGQVQWLIYTGEPDTMWASTSDDHTQTNTRYVRRIQQIGDQLVVDTTTQIDLGTSVIPYSLAYDGIHLYVGAFAAGTPKDITKIYIG